MVNQKPAVWIQCLAALHVMSTHTHTHTHTKHTKHTQNTHVQAHMHAYKQITNLKANITHSKKATQTYYKKSLWFACCKKNAEFEMTST